MSTARPEVMNDEPSRVIPGYVKSERRSPQQTAWPRVPSRADATGPAFAVESVLPGECDLSAIAPDGARALGQLITVTGRVLDEDGNPVRRTLIEMWQANSAGKYVHH